MKLTVWNFSCNHFSFLIGSGTYLKVSEWIHFKVRKEVVSVRGGRQAQPPCGLNCNTFLVNVWTCEGLFSWNEAVQGDGSWLCFSCKMHSESSVVPRRSHCRPGSDIGVPSSGGMRWGPNRVAAGGDEVPRVPHRGLWLGKAIILTLCGLPKSPFFLPRPSGPASFSHFHCLKVGMSCHSHPKWFSL